MDFNLITYCEQYLKFMLFPDDKSENIAIRRVTWHHGIRFFPYLKYSEGMSVDGNFENFYQVY